MDAIAPTGFVEQFHLLFLAQLTRRVKPALFVLKGGCNLRFFHGSIRYSEDMDLDLGEIGAGAFRDEVREILASRPFAQTLEARGFAVERVSEPKQTDTTQRWKLGLRVQGTASPLPTKIECSRRPRVSACTPAAHRCPHRPDGTRRSWTVAPRGRSSGCARTPPAGPCPRRSAPPTCEAGRGRGCSVVHTPVQHPLEAAPAG